MEPVAPESPEAVPFPPPPGISGFLEHTGSLATARSRHYDRSHTIIRMDQTHLAWRTFLLTTKMRTLLLLTSAGKIKKPTRWGL